MTGDGAFVFYGSSLCGEVHVRAMVVVSMESKASWASIEDDISVEDPGQLVVLDSISAARIGVAWFCVC